MPVLVRRDRSLGGKEVVVAWGQRSDTNPLSPPRIRRNTRRRLIEWFEPEMEMVSRGLEKHLKPEQREQLMFLFGKVCGEDSHRIAREALGLMHSQNGFSDQLEDNIAP
ncbi:hypothetical protein JHK82_029591 [Glycine max]|nr:hypothetical protein JHK85_030231 [Glycine max]KAG5005567.1 hypothetical protein JHK86_029706 [Glycine max]KAG5128756.1 hypothetical protein JHK82_029591 [Glycine max]KAG5153364.1 hypothetical protein JHK84_029836 [Glycine max]KHN37275.1 hypothetical protein glysoja_013490 [Glycine soja]